MRKGAVRFSIARGAYVNNPGVAPQRPQRFNCLRHIFRTRAEECKDNAALIPVRHARSKPDPATPA